MLLQKKKQPNDLDYQNLSKESTMARNHVVLEHVIAQRNMRKWKDLVLQEIHDDFKTLDSKMKSKSQSTGR